MKKNKQIVFIFFNEQSYNLFVKKKCKNFCPLFKKILALKVIMHMCMKVKVRVNTLICDSIESQTFEVIRNSKVF